MGNMFMETRNLS